ncbi:MAG: hypothetical protein AAFY06_10145 [Pseudomonadota bacterium]
MLINQKFLAVVSIWLAALPANADVSPWKEVGGWDISFYPNSRGCLGMANYDSGTSFFIGFSMPDDGLLFEISLMNDDWVSIEKGKEYSITVTFGDENPWTLDMYGEKFGTLPGLQFTIDANAESSGRFVDEFKRETSMTWSFNGNSLGYMTLRGSRNAFDEVVACQRSFNEALRSISTDPFQQGFSTTEDPFR